MLNDIAAMAAQLSGCPIATVSIADQERRWFNGSFGLDRKDPGPVHAFSLRWLTSKESVQIRDTRSHSSLAKDPLVNGEGLISSILAVPIIIKEGHSIGVMSLFNGSTAGPLDSNSIRGLEALAGLVPELMETRNEGGPWKAKPAQDGVDPVDREELGKELHDGVGQWLTAANLYTQVLKGKTKGQDELLEDLNSLEGVVQKAQDEVRFISHSMAGVELRNHGLASAISALVQRFQGLSTAPSIHSEIRIADEERLSHHSKLALYRVVQEFLNNSLKYSEAEFISINLEGSSQRTMIHLEDCGQGFDPQYVEEGVGLQSMRGRIVELGGTFELDSAPDKGVRVDIDLPHEA